MINKKYSYNGYYPNSQEVLAEKAKLKEDLLGHKITPKEYSALCTAMKSGWKGKSIKDVPTKELNNTEIVQTSFSQKEPNTVIFPDGMVGVTFTRCNLNNVVVPIGNTVNGGVNKQHKPQNDGEEWEIDKDEKPVEPLNKKIYERLGISIDPKVLPAEKMTESILTKKVEDSREYDLKEKFIALSKDPIRLAEWVKVNGKL